MVYVLGAHRAGRKRSRRIKSYGQLSLPIDYGTFHLGDDGRDEPVEVLCAALEKGS